jgi:hypothetical protein
MERLKGIDVWAVVAVFALLAAGAVVAIEALDGVDNPLAFRNAVSWLIGLSVVSALFSVRESIREGLSRRRNG